MFWLRASARDQDNSTSCGRIVMKLCIYIERGGWVDGWVGVGPGGSSSILGEID